MQMQVVHKHVNRKCSVIFFIYKIIKFLHIFIVTCTFLKILACAKTRFIRKIRRMLSDRIFFAMPLEFTYPLKKNRSVIR